MADVKDPVVETENKANNASGTAANKTVETAAVKPTKEVLPTKRSFKALLIDIQEATNNNFVATLGLPDGTVKELWINRSYWLGKDGTGGLSKRFSADTYVSVSTEDTQAGVTTYTDEEDEVQFHTTTGSRFLNFTKITQGMYNAEMPMNQDDLDIITNGGASAMALATYLGTVRGAQMK